MNQRLRIEEIDSPLVSIRPVKTVLLVIVTGDRGLCGGYNNLIIRKVETLGSLWIAGDRSETRVLNSDTVGSLCSSSSKESESRCGMKAFACSSLAAALLEGGCALDIDQQ